VRSLLTNTKSFFWPDDRSVRLRRAELTFWAFLLAVAYLPLPFGFIAWFALARPLAIISRMTPGQAFKAAYLFAFMHNLFHLYWVATVTPPGMVAAVFILSLYPAAVLAAYVKLYRFRKYVGLIALPILWVGMEYFRSLTEFAFPWTDLAYSQGYYLTLIQIVSVVGCYGLSLALVVVNIMVWRLFNRANRLEARVTAVIVILGLLGGLYLYGWVVFPPYPETGPVRVSLLQGNVDLATKWRPETRLRSFELYDSLSQEAMAAEPQLIVWPETSAPSYPRVEARYRRLLGKTVAATGTNHLIGALDVIAGADKEKSYNAAFQFNPDGSMGTVYHKVKLVPFSEHVPYQDHLSFLSRDFLARYLDIIKTRQVQWWSDFYPGDSIVIFDMDTATYAVLICFESAFPDYVRHCVRSGAEFLVNITNDTWFGRSPGPYQHMRLAVFRAVENRCWLVRCANTGISAFIDPYGRERERLGLYEQGILTARISPVEGHGFFTETGPICGQISSLIMTAIFVILIVLWLRKRILYKRL